jgi:hypothetical protein
MSAQVYARAPKSTHICTRIFFALG